MDLLDTLEPSNYIEAGILGWHTIEEIGQKRNSPHAATRRFCEKKVASGEWERGQRLINGRVWTVYALKGTPRVL